MESGPVFEDAVGAQFLTTVLTLPTIVNERHDTLEFLNHIYIRHTVRLVVSVDGLPSSPISEHRRGATGPPSGRRILQTEKGRTVVPLGDLDRHSRATTHITDEAGEIVPLFTASKLNELLGGGLVAYAKQILRDELSPELTQYLRQIPLTASADLQSADLGPEEAAESAFDKACEDLLVEFGPEAMKLLMTLEFRLALAAITSAVHLVVDVDPAAGPTRVLTYSYMRPITPKPRDSGLLRRWWRPVTRYWLRSGTTKLRIDLGAMGGCDRYHLTAEAPFDTWFSSARIVRAGDADEESDSSYESVDTSQGFRLSYTETSSPTPWPGVLKVQLRTVYTGVARASVYATAFLALCAIAGLVRVILEPSHQLITSETDSAASILLLFPGIAASAVAGAAANKLTATLQFPMRITLWAMSLASFVLAVATAFHLSGTASIVLWSAVTFIVCLAAIALRLRSRAWDHARHAPRPKPSNGGSQ
ncbi:MAG TPA: hypothetical protein VFX45_00580 [Solirubrobacterales bacterium]|nr:hypothetical protein [Solirubrobacterales bacterium]